MSLPQQTDKILNITAHSANMSVMVYQDKVNIKGDMEAEIIYTLTDSADIQHHIQNYAYNQVVDISGISENNAAYADISVISFTVTQNPDTKKIRCILTAQLDVKVFRRESVYTVFDAFSKKYEYNREKKTIVCDENIQSVNKTIRCSVEDTIGAGYTPVHHFVNISAPETTVRKDRNILKAKLTVSAVVKNSTNEYECFTKTGDITIDTGTEINTDDEYILSCCPSQSTAAISDDILKVAASIEVTGFVIKRRQLSVLSDFTENTDSPAEAPANALILYYASKGERVFDIAMKYRTDADIIAKENSLDTAKLTEDKMLFIPAFGM